MIKHTDFCRSCAYRNGLRHCEDCHYDPTGRPTRYRPTNTEFVRVGASGGYYKLKKGRYTE